VTRFALPLCLAALAAACADAVTAPVALLPRVEPDLVATLARKAEGVTVTTSQGTAEGVRVMPGEAVRWCCACPIRPGAPDEQPLIVIDGVPIEPGSQAEIEPEEIVDVQILKGFAATERYGSAGRYGVILVRTSRSTARAGP
jgi:hypothetical protein